ncbi:MAG: hypothetical protein NZL95_09535 [Chitinophagales bacterium]|nr:hypothetical protein [Chitinophagales bacterium]MDW8428775.1 hypothetical protein [Chitinophagales bacterium]
MSEEIAAPEKQKGSNTVGALLLLQRITAYFFFFAAFFAPFLADFFAAFFFVAIVRNFCCTKERKDLMHD